VNPLILKRGEIFFVSIVSTILILVTSLPHLFAFFDTSLGEKYLGASSLLSGDYYSYLSWITQAHDGVFLMRDLYAPEYEGGYLFHPLFLLLGLFAKFSGLGAPLAYHFARIFFIGVFCFSVHLLYSLFTKNIRERQTALLLLVSAGGFGAFFGKFSADISMPEINMFLSLHISLLNIVSLSLATLFAYVALRYLHERNWRVVIVGALLLSALALVHTYDVILFGMIFFVYAITRFIAYRDYDFLMNMLWVFALTLPSIIWQSVVLLNDQALSMWYFLQVSTFSPNLFSYVSGLGVLLLLACWGMHTCLRDRTRETLFFVVWLTVVFLMLYNPLLPSLGRKFVEGIQIPLAFFASIAFLQLFHKGVMLRIFALFLAFLLIATNVEMLYKDIFYYSSHERPRAISSDEVSAMKWIRENTSHSDIFLSEVFIGNIIPALTARPVYMGHNDQTLNFELKNHILGYAFAYGHNVPHLWAKLLNDGEISYVVEDKEVRSLGGQIGLIEGLVPVFMTDSIVVYKVFQRGSFAGSDQ